MQLDVTNAGEVCLATTKHDKDFEDGQSPKPYGPGRLRAGDWWDGDRFYGPVWPGVNCAAWAAVGWPGISGST